MKRSPLRRVSGAHRARTAGWRKVTRQRAESVEFICEASIRGVCDGYGVHGHHVIRRSQGGPDSFENCRWLCASCHEWTHRHPFKAFSLGLLKSAVGRLPAPSAEDAPVERPTAAPSARPQPMECPTHSIGSADTSLEPMGSGRFTRYSTREANG